MKNYLIKSVKILLILILYLLSTDLYGQYGQPKIESVTVLENRNMLNVYGFAKEAIDTLEMAPLQVRYCLTYIAASEMKPRESDWVLLVGTHHTRCYNVMYERADFSVLATLKEHGRVLFAQQMPLEPAGEVYRDIAKNGMRVIQRMPFQKTYAVSYTQLADTTQWVMCTETDSIGRYLCHKARKEYGDRTWTAWYAPAIPVDAGPWKLFGLPGLILRATDDTGSFVFDMRSLEQKPMPIIRYSLPFKEQTKEKWLRSECGFHLSPAIYFNDGGKNVFFEHGSSVELGKTWSVIYNPIEWPK